MLSGFGEIVLVESYPGGTVGKCHIRRPSLPERPWLTWSQFFLGTRTHAAKLDRVREASASMEAHVQVV